MFSTAQIITLLVSVLLYGFVHPIAAWMPVAIYLLFQANSAFQARFSTPYYALKKTIVFAFVNSKGGVGKTTSIMFAVKEISRRFPRKKVLVIDASLYGNLTTLMSGEVSHSTSTSLGNNLAAKGCTIEDASKAWANPKRGLFSLFQGRKTLHSYISKISQSIPSAPKNVYLMTTKAHCENYGLLRENISFTDEALSRVCNEFRRLLDEDAKNDKESDGWVVFIDTDGEMHDLTQIAIGMADSLIIPLSAGMNARTDALRLTVAFDLASRLYDKGLSRATVDYAFVNNADCYRKEAWAGSPFTPQNAVQDIMKANKELFDEWYGGKYKKILVPLTKPFEECMGAIRAGGKEFRECIRDPWGKDAGNAQGDIEAFVDKLMRIVPGQGVDGKRLF